MTNCEHLIENALTYMKKAAKSGTDVYESFQDEMSRKHNAAMLRRVNVTRQELWEIAQYIMYVWEQ